MRLVLSILRDFSDLIDQEGRYSFKNQPSICKWNLEKLADAFGFLLDDKHLLHLEKFDSEYQRHYLSKMRKKVRVYVVFQPTW